jgi:hypothetical protein
MKLLLKKIISLAKKNTPPPLHTYFFVQKYVFLISVAPKSIMQIDIQIGFEKFSTNIWLIYKNNALDKIH